MIKNDTQKNFLRVFCILILMVLLCVTVLASMDKNVFLGAKIVVQELWGLATLLDAYFAFYLFYFVVIFPVLDSALKKVIWFFAVGCLGSFALSGFVLFQLRQIGNRE